MPRKVIDVSVSIGPGLPVWPGDPPVLVEPALRIARGDGCNVTLYSLGTHTGSHVDAPSHFVEGGKMLDEVPIDVLVGPAWVAEPRVVDGQVTVSSLEQSRVPDGVERLLVKTENSAMWVDERHAFRPDFVHLSDDAADWIVRRNIKLVGVDYLSVEGYREGHRYVHNRLLTNDIIIVETLNLAEASPGPCELYCLPLKLQGADGAPARVILVQDVS